MPVSAATSTKGDKDVVSVDTSAWLACATRPGAARTSCAPKPATAESWLGSCDARWNAATTLLKRQRSDAGSNIEVAKKLDIAVARDRKCVYAAHRHILKCRPTDREDTDSCATLRRRDQRAWNGYRGSITIDDLTRRRIDRCPVRKSDLRSSARSVKEDGEAI